MSGRNIHRPIDPTMPTISVCATDHIAEQSWASQKSNYIPGQQECVLKSRFLRLKPIKTGFDMLFFKKNYLPKHAILKFRDLSGSVSTLTLSKLANDLVNSIKVGEKKFKHFIVLKDFDFNYKTLSGLLILKFKDYPFVIKLSIEHPHTLIQPFSKSWQTDCIFIIGGNLRHLSNFTRISNLKRIQSMLSYNPFYLQFLDFPRKWYWQPDHNYDLKIKWKCNGTYEQIIIPSAYAVISDFIATDPIQPQHQLNNIAMKVATDTGFLIDPHAGNFVIEQSSNKCILLDTEDFRLITGLDQSMKATKYIGWWIELIWNGFQSLCLCSKEQRIKQSTMA